LLGVVVVAVVMTAIQAGIYPADHFQYATKIDSEEIHNRLVSEAVNGDHTLFIRWIASEG